MSSIEICRMRALMEADRDLKDDFEKYGRVWLRDAVSEADLSLFDESMADEAKAGERLVRSAALDSALSGESSLLDAIRKLEPEAQPVRTVAFNKSESPNWGVPWHQDRVIAVAGQANVEGFRNWTKKSGVWHCEPPVSVLDQMLFVRVHLDDANPENGAMEIAVGSHSKGIIPSVDAEKEAATCQREICNAKRGDVLVLKMLTLHTSRPAQVRSGRRVLRIDFSSCPLPLPLSWIEAGGESGLPS